MADTLAVPIPQGEAQVSEQEAKFPITLPPGLTLDFVKQRAKEFRKAWVEWMRAKTPQLEAYNKMFQAEATGAKESKNDMVLPVAPGVVETLTSRLVKVVWGRDKIIDAMPLDPGVNKEIAGIVEDFLNQELIYKSRGTKKGKSLIKAAIIEGVGMWREMWNVKKETRLVPIYDPPMPMPGIEPMYMGEQEQEFEVSGWDWEESDPLKVCFDPLCSDSIASSPYGSWRTHMSLAELKVWEESGKIQNVDAIAAITPSYVNDKEDWDKKKAAMLGRGLSNFQYGDNKEYIVDEWFLTLTWEVDQEGQDEKGNPLPKKVMTGKYHCIMVEEEVCILFEENDLKPKRIPGGSFPFIIDPRKVFGKSGLHDIRGIQGLVDTFGGKQVDLVKQAANRTTYYDQRSGISGRTAFQRVGGMVRVDDVNGIKEGTIDTRAIEATQGFITYLIEYARNVTAATEQAQGLEGAKTATEFAGLVQLVGTRFEDLADNIIQYFCVPLAQGCLDFYQQYGVDGQMVVRESSIDGESKIVTRQMLSGRWQIVPSGQSAQANKDARVKAAIEVMKILMELGNNAMANPAMTQGQIPNMKAYFDEVLMVLMDQRQPNNLWTQAPIPVLPGMPPAAGGLPPMPPDGALPVGAPAGPSPEQMGMDRPQ